MFKIQCLFSMSKLLVIVSAFCTLLYGQNITRIDQTKPHIYLSFDSKTENNVLLRLTNNSNWAIKVCVRAFIPTVPANMKKVVLLDGQTKFAFVDNKQVRLCYGVEYFNSRGWFTLSKKGDSKKEKLTISELGKKCKTSYCGFYEDDNYGGEGWVASGNSVLFEVPTEYIKENHRIYIRYNYEWEEESGYYPTHFVYFYSTNIPKK